MADTNSPAEKSAPASQLSFSKEDLIHLATDASSTIAIRRSAAEALYRSGVSEGARQVADAYSVVRS